jgi:uncharacterized protein YdeI (YjbR/CyaY-like superfamily)
MSKLEHLNEIYAKNQAAFRDWLSEHHAIANGVWLVYYKKNSGIASITYPEAVKEALC